MRQALFFTFEMSLAAWERAGILGRELSLYRELSRRAGVRTCLVTYGGTEDLKYFGEPGSEFEVLPLFQRGPRNKWLRFFLSWLAPFRCREILRRVDWVKTNQMWGAWVGLICKVIFRKKWILRCGFEHHRFLLLQQAGLRDRAFSYLLGWIGYRLADAVLWSSQADLAWAVEYFGLRAEDPRFEVIPNFVDTGLFHPRQKSPPLTAALTVARLDKQKNLETVISALQGTGLELEVVGEGELRGELEALADRLGVKADFTGRLPQEAVAERMTSGRIFILASHYEGLPKALLEAMACSMAVIGANVPGIREVIAHQENGLLVEPDADSLRQAITRLAADSDLRARLGASAARCVESRYSLEKVAQKELGLYRKLLQGKP